MKRAIPILLAIGVLVALDQIVKIAVSASLEPTTVMRVLPVFSLYLTFNTGVAFSMFEGAGPWPLIALTLVVCAVMGALWWRTAAGRWLSHVGFGLIIAGAIGNLIDRVRLSHVIDYILIHTPDYGWTFAVFNLADAFISIGAVAIIADEFVGPRFGSKPHTKPTPKDEQT